MAPTAYDTGGRAGGLPGFEDGALILDNLPIDFARHDLPDLDSLALDETVGVQSPVEGRIRYFAKGKYPTGAFRIGPAMGPVDWTGNGMIESGSISLPGLNASSQKGCNGLPYVATYQARSDWNALVYRIEPKLDDLLAAEPELDPNDQLDSMLGDPDYDHDGLLNVDDNCPVVANIDQEDAGGAAARQRAYSGAIRVGIAPIPREYREYTRSLMVPPPDWEYGWGRAAGHVRPPRADDRRGARRDDRPWSRHGSRSAPRRETSSPAPVRCGRACVRSTGRRRRWARRRAGPAA